MAQAKKGTGEAFTETLVDVSRVTKVVKGGRKFSFWCTHFLLLNFSFSCLLFFERTVLYV